MAGVAVGTIIAGSYRILRPLSEGGMGSVFVAEQVTTRMQRALKTMKAELVASPRLRERFEQEARIASRIDSEHVVQVIDSGIDRALGVPWLAMELLDGVTLAQHVAARGPISAYDARGVFGQLCHAVGAAHRAGIVHRDLKPENVFLARSRLEGGGSTVKVLDFGIAKLLDDVGTRATGALGTPLYMPPEQMMPGRSIVPASDVWALGLIAFFLLTGKSYWLAGNQESNAMMVLNEVTNYPMPPASQRARELGVAFPLPPGFDAWFARATHRTIEARFANAGELVDALRAILVPPGAADARLGGGSTGDVLSLVPATGPVSARSAGLMATELAQPPQMTPRGPASSAATSTSGQAFATAHAPGPTPYVAAPAQKRSNAPVLAAVVGIAIVALLGVCVAVVLVVRSADASRKQEEASRRASQQHQDDAASERERRLAEEAANARREKEEAEKKALDAAAKQADLEKKIVELQLQLSNAKSDDEKKALQAKLDQLRNPPSVQPTTPQHVKPHPQPPKPACTCQAGDPLCECW